MSLWDCSKDIQLHSVHHFSLNSRLEFPRDSFDAVEQRPSPESSFGTLRMLLAKTIPCKVPTTVSDSSLRSRGKSPHATSPRLGDLSLGLLQVKYLFRPRHISTWHSRATVSSAIACHSISSTVRSANNLSCKSYTPWE